jgi:phosphinothricin acetyltransferase
MLRLMSEISIRGAGPNDIPGITQIYAEAVMHGTASFEIEPPDEAEMARRCQTLRADRFPYMVATHDGAVVGYAYAGPYRSRPAYKWTVEDSIYVSTGFHRKGIGSILLRSIVRQSAILGFRQMIAVIGDSAQTASIALHEKAGFAMIGTLRSVGFKHGKWLDTPLMQLALGDGDRTLP